MPRRNKGEKRTDPTTRTLHAIRIGFIWIVRFLKYAFCAPVAIASTKDNMSHITIVIVPSFLYNQEMVEGAQAMTKQIETKPWPVQIKAIIFDMDGLMIDSEPFHHRAFDAVFRQFGRELTAKENAEEYVGISDLDAARKMVAKYGFIDSEGHKITAEDLAKRAQAEYMKLITGQIAEHIQPGLRELLQTLKVNGFRMAIASGSTKAEIEGVIRALKLEEFFGDHYYSAEEVEKGKPHPDLFSYAAHRLGVGNNECLVLEDANSGIAAATKAHMHSYAIPSAETGEFRNAFLNAERQLRSLGDVETYLRIDSPDSFSQ